MGRLKGIKHGSFALLLTILIVGCALVRSPGTVPQGPRTSIVKVSYYGERFNGKKTATGEIFNMNRLTAAHRSLPFGTKVHLKNRANGRETTVVINDRGPYVPGRDLDISQRAARQLGIIDKGVVAVEMKVIGYPST